MVRKIDLIVKGVSTVLEAEGGWGRGCICKEVGRVYHAIERLINISRARTLHSRGITGFPNG